MSFFMVQETGRKSLYARLERLGPKPSPFATSGRLWKGCVETIGWTPLGSLLCKKIILLYLFAVGCIEKFFVYPHIYFFHIIFLFWYFSFDRWPPPAVHEGISWKLKNYCRIFLFYSSTTCKRKYIPQNVQFVSFAWRAESVSFLWEYIHCANRGEECPNRTSRWTTNTAGRTKGRGGCIYIDIYFIEGPFACTHASNGMRGEIHEAVSRRLDAGDIHDLLNCYYTLQYM